MIPGYADIRLENDTPFKVEYKIDYGNTWFCSNDYVEELGPYEVEHHPRGSCLVTLIDVEVSGKARCTYKSAGTTYSQFKIELVEKLSEHSKYECTVTRI